MTDRLLAAAGLAALLAAPAIAEDLPEGALAADPPAPLTLFQWALVHADALMLVPHEGYLYPAERAGEAVVETLPPALLVTRHHDGAKMRVPVSAIHAPHEVTGGGWIMERHDGEAWHPVAAMHFHGARFYGQDSPGPFEPLAPESVRFRAR